MEALCAVTEELPIGTNLGLLRFLWMQINGSLLPSRGAIFPSTTGNWTTAYTDTSCLGRLSLRGLAD